MYGDQIQAHIEEIDTVQFTLVQESQHKTQALTSSTARVLSNSTTPSARVVYGGRYTQCTSPQYRPKVR
ncbi:MAG: hypothetical protein IPI14_06065 [Polaromonas sp.]|nr:hypothetical protein [Polaromonas sp.]